MALFTSPLTEYAAGGRTRLAEQIKLRETRVRCKIKDGLIASEHVYSDSLEMMTQLGLMPAPEVSTSQVREVTATETHQVIDCGPEAVNGSGLALPCQVYAKEAL